MSQALTSQNVSVSRAKSRAAPVPYDARAASLSARVASLRHRPFLWMAPAIGLGCAGGSIVANRSTQGTRADAGLLLPLIAACGFMMLAFAWRRVRPDGARLALCGALVAAMTSHAARRLLPPANDVSLLTRPPAHLMGPLPKRTLPMQGWVADFPNRSEFGQEFPLQCQRVNGRLQTGRVWVSAPLEPRLEVGDAVKLTALLTDLPRPLNPGERDQSKRFIIENCWCQGQVKHSAPVVVVHRGDKFPLLRAISRLRAVLLHHYEAAFEGRTQAWPDWTARPYPRATAQLLCAMVFGEGGLSEPLPYQTRQQFRAAGLSHVLVASGTQVSFLTLFLLGGARLMGLRRAWLLPVVLPILMLYALLAGGGASIWRATVGGGCVALSLLTGRDVDALSLWSLAFGFLLALDPAQAWSLSFQLTFAATWGLIALAPVIRRFLARWTGVPNAVQDADGLQNVTAMAGIGAGGRVLQADGPGEARSGGWSLDLIAFSLAAQAATLPVLLFQFGRASAAGLGANFLAVPLAGLLVGTGLIGLVLPIAPVSALNYGLTRGVAGLGFVASQIPGAQVETLPIRPFPVLLLCALLLLLAADAQASDALWMRARKAISQRLQRLPWRTMLVAGALSAALWSAWAAWSRPRVLRMCVLDVGQGESILIVAPSGRAVLVDGGTTSGERGDVGKSVIVPALQAYGVRRLEAIVATHDDSDHLNALPAVMNEVPVGLLLDGAAWNNPGSAEHQDLLQAARENHVSPLRPHQGQTLDLGDGARLTVLAPIEPRLESDNNNGIMMRLDYGQTSALLTADIEREAEERIARRGMDLHCTVLKVGHHGSKTSTFPLLLQRAHPKMALVSCGRYNPFGHPAPVTLERLQRANIPVYRTDLDGALEMQSDGRNCWVQTMR